MSPGSPGNRTTANRHTPRPGPAWPGYIAAVICDTHSLREWRNGEELYGFCSEGGMYEVEELCRGKRFPSIMQSRATRELKQLDQKKTTRATAVLYEHPGHLDAHHIPLPIPLARTKETRYIPNSGRLRRPRPLLVDFQSTRNSTRFREGPRRDNGGRYEAKEIDVVIYR